MVRRDWTLNETLFLKTYAGTKPLSAIACDLHRNPRDVASECGRLSVPIIYLGTPLFWCNECSSWRSKITKEGICVCCTKHHQLQKLEGKIAKLLTFLSVCERETYATTEAKRASRKQDPKPSAPYCVDMSPRDEIKARSKYYAELDQWETKQISRQVKAVQKRKERIQKKLIASRLHKGTCLELCLDLAYANL